MNPVDRVSNNYSRGENGSSHGEDFIKNLQEFEISQLNQKQRRPRGSDFLGEKDFYSLKKSLLSKKGFDMGTIHEDDDVSSQYQEVDDVVSIDDVISKYEGNEQKSEKSVTCISEDAESKYEKVFMD
jgi:hypothetical protein